LGFVRNAPVHTDGVIKIENKALLDLPTKYPGLTVTPFKDGTAIIGIEKDFCEHAIDVFYAFFEKVQQAMWKQ
jgi:hypothetical protein